MQLFYSYLHNTSCVFSYFLHFQHPTFTAVQQHRSTCYKHSFVFHFCLLAHFFVIQTHEYRCSHMFKQSPRELHIHLSYACKVVNYKLVSANITTISSAHILISGFCHSASYQTLLIFCCLCLLLAPVTVITQTHTHWQCEAWLSYHSNFLLHSASNLRHG